MEFQIMSRLLTEQEIENILSFIKPRKGIPVESAMAVVNANKDRFRKQLRNQKVYPEIIPALKRELEKTYLASQIQPGECVGVICAQSIGEKQTQTTLNTFHKAGQSEKTMTAGVPRFQELLNATRKPRIVNHKIFFKRGNESIQELRKVVGHSIAGLTLADISVDIEVCLDKSEEPWYKSYKLLYDDSFAVHKHCISFKIDRNKLFDVKLSMDKIADIIHSKFDDLHCVFSPPEHGQFDIFVNTDSIDLPEDRILFVNSSNAVEVYIEECVQPNLENMCICGIEGITEVFYTKDNQEWFVETNGVNSRSISTQYVNYKNIMAHPDVDYTRTISNNVWDIYETLGVEAAREFLIEEFMSIMEGINTCHAQLLVDRMTHGGGISSITRYTLKKDESGPMGKASFEESMDNFLNAAAHGDVEPTKGVSASIVCGKRANIGTGMMELSIDLKKLPLATNF